MTEEQFVEILAFAIYHGNTYDYDNADLLDARADAVRTLALLKDRNRAASLVATAAYLNRRQ